MINLPPIDSIPLNSPQIGPDGARYVKLFIEGAVGDNVEFTHHLGREPFSIFPVWANKAIKIPEAVSASRDKASVKFAETDFTVLMRVL